MDFIARAGTVIDRSHRVAGFFLVATLALGFVVVMMSRSNTELTNEIQRLSKTRQVYVVPGSQAGFYAPTKPEMLLENFGDYIVQSLNTYTYVNLEPQFTEAQRFFTPAMLMNAKPFYAERIRDARQDEHSALFVYDRRSVQVTPSSAPSGAGVDERANYYDYVVEGRRQDIIGDQVISSKDLRITLTVKQTAISKSNPWGFMLARYKEESI